MTQGPGWQFEGNPAEGWASPNAPWAGAEPTVAAHTFNAHQQPVWSPGGQQFGQPGGPPFGQPQQHNRKPLIIGLSIAGALLLVIIVVVSIVVFSGGGGKSSPGEAVKGYLEALAKGDAATALSYSNDEPASKDLLTDEILQKQIDKWPITDIRILNDDGGYGLGRVHVSAKFGDQTSDETISVKKSGKTWKLEHAAIKLGAHLSVNDEAEKTLTVFGNSISDSPAYVFPGWVDIGSDNPNLKVELKKPLLLNQVGLSGEAYLTPEFSISDKGNRAITSAIRSELDKCTSSTSLSPRDCPQRVYKYELVDGTAAWGPPDISGLKIEASGYNLEARINGQVVFPLTARTRSGDTWNGTVTSSVFGKADLKQDPPTVNLS